MTRSRFSARILKGDNDIHFLLSGEGVSWTRLAEMQAASALPNVTLLERGPETDLEHFLSAGDLKKAVEGLLSVYVLPVKYHCRCIAV